MADIKGLREAIMSVLKPKFEIIGEIVVGRAIKFCPADRGKARQSIRHKVILKGDKLVVEIGSNLDYFKDLEYGFRRHFVPFSKSPELMKWAQRHGINTSKRKGLWVELETGTPENPKKQKKGVGYSPILRPALYQSQRDIENILNR